MFFAWKLNKIDTRVLMLPNWAQTLTPRDILFGEAMVWESEGNLGRNEGLNVMGEDRRVTLAMVDIFCWIELNDFFLCATMSHHFIICYLSQISYRFGFCIDHLASTWVTMFLNIFEIKLFYRKITNESN